jgi:hypothetical protein
MRVLLISANRLKAPYPVYPLGLDYVAEAIRPQHTVRILDLNPAGAPGELEAVLQTFQPEVIGLGLRNVDNTDGLAPHAFLEPYQTLVQTLRRYSTAPIVLGGSGFTIFPAAMLAQLEVDYGIMGEGERLAGLLAALAEGRSPRGLPGVVVRGDAPMIPPPLEAVGERGDAPPGNATDFYLRRGGMLNLQTKRGCPFKCIYCTYPHIEGRRMRRIPPAAVARTALNLQAAGGRYLFVTDSAFNADPGHSLEVAAAFQEAGLGIPWGGFFAPVRPPKDYFRRLARAGLTHVEFGTEALSDPVLRSYRKPFAVADVYAAHEAALEAGLHVAHYLLLGGPGESPATLEETLANVDKLKRCVVFFFCGMRIYPHTALYRLALETGQVSAGQDLLAPVYFRSPALDANHLAERLRTAAAGRENWVLGAGGEEVEKILMRLHARGFSGPLWEFLIR